MVDVIDTKKRKLTDAGDSRRLSPVKDWLDILGFTGEDEVVTALLHTEKYGFFFGAWKEGEQPDMEEINEEELRDLTDKVDILDDTE